MIGKTILHYQILEKLGEGGMGVVYLAEDLKLKRKVAIKFLPEKVTANVVDRQRFEVEARAAAALNHPNVTQIYTIEEAGGDMFIVMEYVAGQELKQLSIADSRLAIDNVIDIATQIAEGLQAAHQKGIVHRDIKLSNILLTDDGQVKIMDFGLAKLRGEAMELTRAGTTMGTAAYMSPEQNRGDAVDHRTDIWAFGVVLYAMITGELPFKGEYPQAMAYSIMSEEPIPCSEIRSEVSPMLESVVMGCLKKEVDQRYQNMSDVLLALRGNPVETQASELLSQPNVISSAKSPKTRSFTIPAIVFGILLLTALGYFFWPHRASEIANQRKMLVVLPFENRGPSDDDYFAAGITDAITARIASIPGIGVISRQSAIQYQKSEKSSRQIGKELGVNFILDGSVQRENPGDIHSNVRVIPQLVRVSDDTHLWADTYDEEMTGVFRLQSEIAERVAQALDITLLEPERQKLNKKPTKNLDAYDFYLRGKDYASRDVVESDAEKAVEMFEKAVAADTNFATAYAALTRSRVWLGWNFAKPEEIPKAKSAVDNAVRLDPDSPETHLALGFYFYRGSRDYEKALAEFKIVQKQYPNNADAIAALGYIYRRQGKWVDATAHLEKAVTLNPRNYFWMLDLGDSYSLMRQYAKSERFLNRAIELSPDVFLAYQQSIELYVSRDGNTQMARKILQSVPKNVSRESLVNSWVYLENIDGNFQAALNHLSQPYDSLLYYLDKANVYELMNLPQKAHACFDSAKVQFEKEVRRQPEVAYFHAGLGLALAGLQEKEVAIREGENAVALLPVSTDAYTGSLLLEILAWIYVKTENYDAAIDRLAELLTIPSRLSVNKLKIEPNWAPLRDLPRFQELLNKH